MSPALALEFQQPTFIASRGTRIVTPNDSVDLADVAFQLYVTGAGTLKITGLDGVTLTLTITAAMVAGGGYTHPSCVVRVWATGTSVTAPIIAYV